MRVVNSAIYFINLCFQCSIVFCMEIYLGSCSLRKKKRFYPPNKLRNFFSCNQIISSLYHCLWRSNREGFSTTSITNNFYRHFRIHFIINYCQENLIGRGYRWEYFYLPVWSHLWAHNQQDDEP